MVRVRSPHDPGTKVGLKKPESLGYSSVKPHDPRFISFDALPVCDRQTDMLPIAKSNSSTAERDKNDDNRMHKLMQ